MSHAADTHHHGYDPRRPDPDLVAGLVDTLVSTYLADERTTHIDAMFLPSRAECVEVIELLRKLTFPGFFNADAVTGEPTRLTTANISEHTAELLGQLEAKLYEQVRQTQRYLLNQQGKARTETDCPEVDEDAREKTDAFSPRDP